MKFFCLCLSPAIDALVKLPSAPKGAGEIFKDVADEENVGGKTINVARWLSIRRRAGSLVPPAAHLLPSPEDSVVVCGGLLGKDNEALFKKELERFDIGDAFVRVSGSTRRNEMVTWPGGAFKINRAAFPNVDVRKLTLERLLGAAVLCDVAILSGSLPKGAPPSFYADCIAWLKARGVKTVLDASGEALRLGVAAGPDVIKPNAEECEPLVGFVPKTPEEFRRATEILKSQGNGRSACTPWAHFSEMREQGEDPRRTDGAFRRNAPTGGCGPTVIISDGGAGAWFDGEFVPAPKVDVVDTTAAGDTLLAEWCWRTYGSPNKSNNPAIQQSSNPAIQQSNNPTIQQSDDSPARWAVAAGSAACTMPGSQPPSVETVDQLKAREVVK